jgi:hypothetical protein
MQGTYFWNKLHLQRNQILIVGLLLLSAISAEAQKKRWVEKNNPNYDERKLTYGFLIGLHTSTYQLKYADNFNDPVKFPTLHSVIPKWKPGFSLGFIVNYRLNDLLDLRVTPKVGFYEHEVIYRYSDNTPQESRLVETTMVEMPLLLKYKSERRGNIRMYMVGGVKPAIEASGQKELENSETLEVKTSNLHLEAGFGFDLYYPLFKFSPEIRFSRGIVDILENRDNPFGEPLKRVNTNTLTIYFLFQ